MFAASKPNPLDRVSTRNLTRSLVMRTVANMATARNKLLEAAMALLQASPRQQLNVVVLNKALFYLDLHALRDYGTTVTDQEYVALPQGPVVDSYKEILIKPLVEGTWRSNFRRPLAGTDGSLSV